MIKSDEIFPWQVVQWRFLSEYENIPHALLFSGPTGLGKFHFAMAFAHYLQCKKKIDSRACGHCSSCHLSSIGNHPDIQLIEGEGASSTIKIDRIRTVVDWATKSAQLGNYKIVIVKQADQMNVASANALLKTLEEPVGKTLFILVSDYAPLLPATIRSRCQRLHFPAVYNEEAARWVDVKLAHKHNAKRLLFLSGGAPILALALAHDNAVEARQQFYEAIHALITRRANPVSIAADYHKQPLVQTLDFLCAFANDVVQMQLCNTSFRAINSEGLQVMQSIAKNISLPRLYRLYDQILKTKRDILAGANLNPQLLLENIMITLTELVLDQRRVA